MSRERIKKGLKIFLIFLFLLEIFGFLFFYFSEISKIKEDLTLNFPTLLKKTSQKNEIFTFPISNLEKKIKFLKVPTEKEISKGFILLLKEDLKENELFQVLILISNKNRLAKISEILDSFEIKVPKDFYQKIKEEEFNLYLFSQKEGKRLAFAIKIKEKDKLREILKFWEKTMGKDFQNFFVLFDEKLTFFDLFESDEYKEVSFYYQIFNEKDLGIYYSIAKDYFIFVNSKKILEKILEILKLTEREKIKTPLFNIKLPILRYHHVNFLPENPSKALKVLTVSPPMFEKQMKYLFEKGYQPITFKDLINYFKFKEKLPEKPLILTFDDGWENQYQNALPVLKKYNFPATFFVVVNYIGKKNFMDWQQLKEILKLGGEIGSHTLNHPHLLNLSEVQLKKEIQKSKIILEEKLGYPINIFAYPYGEFNSKIIKIVLEAGYFAARSCREGLIQSSKDIFKLKSIRVLEDFEKFKRIFEKE